jgi:anti-sigma regulatory factor (Ser/Thr protein kinase)
MEINLVLEELFTNIVFYAFEDHEHHAITVEFNLLDPHLLELRLEDDGKPFNLLEKQMEDVFNQPLEEREIGGLGIHFVKKMMKSVVYERSGNNNVVVLTKDF